MNQLQNLQNLEAEEEIIGCVLQNEMLFPVVKEIVSEKDFYHAGPQTVFKAFDKLYSESKPIDLITVFDFLDANNLVNNLGGRGSAYLASVVNKTLGSEMKATHYAQMVLEYSKKRQLLEAAFKITQGIESVPFNEVYGSFQSNITSIAGKEKEDGSIKNVLYKLEDIQGKNLVNFASGKELLGLSSGFPTFDKFISGLQPEHYWVITAYTSTGKTFMALNILKSVINQGGHAVFYSLEMSQVDLATRLLSMYNKLGTNKIKSGVFSQYEAERDAEAKDTLSTKKVALYNQYRFVEDICLSVINIHAKEKIDVVFIDYLQHLNCRTGKSKYEKITEASLQLQALAAKLGITIIALSQVDNDSVKNQNSEVIATKGSGDIAGDADFIIRLKRNYMGMDQEMFDSQGYQDIPITAFIQKNRHGNKGKCEMSLNVVSGLFEEVV